MESRGNNAAYPGGGNNCYASTLHWGVNWDQNKYFYTHADYKHTESLGNAFHTYGLYWDEKTLYTYLDDPTNVVLKVDFTEQAFFERGQFSEGTFNPWRKEPNSAPFNKEFHLILNVAVGGVNGYFPDNIGGKPWKDTDGHSVNEFYDSKDQWMPTWNGEDSALQIDSIKVWKFEEDQQKPMFL